MDPSIKGNCQALAWLRGEHSLFVPTESRERNVWLANFSSPDSNVFHVTDESVQQSTVYTNRADAVFLIDGIAVAVAETKAAGLGGV